MCVTLCSSLSGSGGNTSPGGRKAGREGGEGEGEGAGPGTKPHLRVKIPGQKGFVARTVSFIMSIHTGIETSVFYLLALQQATSPLPQMELTTTASGAKASTASTITTTSVQRPDKDGSSRGTTQTTVALTTTTTQTESLTTPVLSLATPNLLSALPPPLFSSLTGDFPFSALMSGGLGSSSGTGGGGGGELSSALVAFPVSIQPSSTTGGSSGAGNIVLQAQNMGQPFLLTPNVDPRQNPMLSQTTFTPPPSSLSPNMRDLEQLKHQYERVHQQLLQQQLFISQQLHHQQQQQQQVLGKEGGGGVGTTSTRKSTPTPPSREVSAQQKEPGGGGGGGGSLAMKEGRSRAQQAVSPSLREAQEDMDTGESVGTPPKRARVESSPEQPTSV